MDDLLTHEIRRRFDSEMSYQVYLDTFDKPPEKPRLRPKGSPLNVEPLNLDPPNGPKLHQQKMPTYLPDEIILEESETDEKQRAKSPTQRPPCFKAMVVNDVRIRSQSENLGFSVLRFLCKKNK